jgi:hypothetical protein
LAASTTKYTARLKPQRVNGYKGEMRIGPYSPPRWRWNVRSGRKTQTFFGAGAGGPSLPPQFRNGSYPFQDLDVHGLYLLEAFLGPIEHADIRYYASGSATPIWCSTNGAAWWIAGRGTGHIYISWNVRPMQNEIIVHGIRGVMHVDCYLQRLSSGG